MGRRAQRAGPLEPFTWCVIVNADWYNTIFSDTYLILR